jgi:hypothetical protein
MSSLFIGNLARGIDEKYLEDEFQKVASCTFRFKVRSLRLHNHIHRAPMLSASTRMRRMPRQLSRTSTTKISMVNASQFNSARRVASTTQLMIDALPAEMTTAEAALLAETMAHPRPATTAASLATSLESAVSLAVIAMTADQEADQTSKQNVTKYQILTNI